MVDSTILKFNKNLWLFTNIMNKSLSDFNKLLYIYKIDSPKLKKIEPHLKNPIIKNLNGGRNAGAIMKIGKNMIRPSQINKISNYGYALKLSKIQKLNLNNYVEKKIKIIFPPKDKSSGIHHVAKINKNKYIIDICLKYSKNR